MSGEVMAPGGSLLRVRLPGAGRVTSMELFFDLVYVFAITQLSHLLLDHLTVGGAFETLLLALAVWWAWVYTAWATNFVDPARRAVRFALLASMAASLLMAAALPEAFGPRGLAFAVGYTALQLGRALFVRWAVRHEPVLAANFTRIVAWLAAGAALWLAGGVAEGATRRALWVAAVAVDFAAPMLAYPVPGLGRSRTTDWTVEGAHMAERCQLLLIVALGESILLTGATFSDLEWGGATVAAAGLLFGGTVGLWWAYFDRSAEDGSEVIAHAADPGRLARSAYTYCHLPMVLGIILAAVGDELVLRHPTGDTTPATALAVLGGPALFLAGHALYGRAIFGSLAPSRVVAVLVLVALVPVGAASPPLVVAALTLAVLVGLAAVDSQHAPLPRGGAPVAAP